MFGTTGGGIFLNRQGKIKKYGADDGMRSRYTWRLYQDKNKNIWVTSYLGISIWNGDGFTPFNLDESSFGVQLNSVLHDLEGNSIHPFKQLSNELFIKY